MLTCADTAVIVRNAGCMYGFSGTLEKTVLINNIYADSKIN